MQISLLHCFADLGFDVDSYASFSSGGKNRSMVIDLQNFQGISVGTNGSAIIGGGVRLGDLALGLYNQSRRALPHGTCPGVGIGGHASREYFSLLKIPYYLFMLLLHLVLWKILSSAGFEYYWEV